MTDSEKLNNIEKYILDLEKSMSNILTNSSHLKVKFENFDKMSNEITGLRNDFNILSHDFHTFKEKIFTISKFENFLNIMLSNTENEVKKKYLMVLKNELINLKV